MGGPWAHIWALYKFPFPKQAPAGTFFPAKKLPFPKQAPAGAFFPAEKLPFPKQAPAGAFFSAKWDFPQYFDGRLQPFATFPLIS